MIRLSVLFAVLVAASVAVQAQPVEPAGASVYRYVAPGRPSVTVDVWGGVAQPGRYLVEPTVSLLDVLALSGGPALVAGDDQASRTATVTVTRGQGDARTVAARLTLADLADGAAVPTIRDGDLVVVRTSGAGRVAVPVDVWGAVGDPGRYEVAPGATLVDVLTLAGGPLLATDDDRVSRTATVTLTRAASAGRTPVYQGTLEDLEVRAPLAVEPGDLVSVRLSQRQRFTWRDALTVATGTASVAVLLLRVIGGS